MSYNREQMEASLSEAMTALFEAQEACNEYAGEMSDGDERIPYRRDISLAIDRALNLLHGVQTDREFLEIYDWAQEQREQEQESGN